MAMIRSLLSVMALVCFCAGSQLGLASAYKPIVLVNSFPPNGSADIVGRATTGKVLRLMTNLAAPAVTDLLAARTGAALGLILDRVVKIDRRAHGRSIPGIEYVINSLPDGNTLLFMNNIELLVQPRLYRVPYLPRRDLLPVAAVARMPIVMIALSNGGPTNVREFLEAARASPGDMNYASSGDFRSGHLAGELFARRNGLSLVHVPYNGGSNALNGIVKGHVPIAFVPLPSVLPAIPGGKIRIIAIADLMRFEALPDVPTLSESGMPGFEAASWFGIYVPSGTRPDSVARINHAVVTGLQSIRTESWLRSQGLQARNPDAIQYGELMRGEYEKWMPVLDQLNPPY